MIGDRESESSSIMFLLTEGFLLAITNFFFFMLRMRAAFAWEIKD
jgi:hypothetical protein